MNSTNVRFSLTWKSKNSCEWLVLHISFEYEYPSRFFFHSLPPGWGFMFTVSSNLLTVKELLTVMSTGLWSSRTSKINILEILYVVVISNIDHKITTPGLKKKNYQAFLSIAVLCLLLGEHVVFPRVKSFYFWTGFSKLFISTYFLQVL